MPGSSCLRSFTTRIDDLRHATPRPDREGGPRNHHRRVPRGDASKRGIAARILAHEGQREAGRRPGRERTGGRRVLGLARCGDQRDRRAGRGRVVDGGLRPAARSCHGTHHHAEHAVPSQRREAEHPAGGVARVPGPRLPPANREGQRPGRGVRVLGPSAPKKAAPGSWAGPCYCGPMRPTTARSTARSTPLDAARAAADADAVPGGGRVGDRAGGRWRPRRHAGGASRCGVWDVETGQPVYDWTRPRQRTRPVAPHRALRRRAVPRPRPRRARRPSPPRVLDLRERRPGPSRRFSWVAVEAVAFPPRQRRSNSFVTAGSVLVADRPTARASAHWYRGRLEPARGGGAAKLALRVPTVDAAGGAGRAGDRRVPRDDRRRNSPTCGSRDRPPPISASRRGRAARPRSRFDGGQFAIGYERAVGVYHTVTGEQRFADGELEAEVTGVAFDPGGKWLYVGRRDGTLVAYHTGTFAKEPGVVFPLDARANPCTGAVRRFAPDRVRRGRATLAGGEVARRRVSARPVRPTADRPDRGGGGGSHCRRRDRGKRRPRDRQPGCPAAR